MKKMEFIEYPDLGELNEALALLNSIIEPEDNITIIERKDGLYIVASERDIKALKLHLAHVDL